MPVGAAEKGSPAIAALLGPEPHTKGPLPSAHVAGEAGHQSRRTPRNAPGSRSMPQDASNHPPASKRQARTSGEEERPDADQAAEQP